MKKNQDKQIRRDYDTARRAIEAFRQEKTGIPSPMTDADASDAGLLSEERAKTDAKLSTGSSTEHVEMAVEMAHQIAKIDKERGAVKLKETIERKRIAGRVRRLWQAVGSIAAVAAVVVVWQFMPVAEPEQVPQIKPVDLAQIKVPVIVYAEENDAVVYFDSLKLKKGEAGARGEVELAEKPSREIATGQMEKVHYNKILIPRGYTFRAKLPDGSTVVLNAGSELKYPVRFQDTLREVELVGEGYFEVAKAEVPFVVKAGSTQVKVYGTKFNVLYSEDLDLAEAVLLEGSIGMQAGGNEVRLAPNERAYCMPGDSLLQVEKVDATAYINWLGTTFKYDGMRLDRIAWDLSRWYGVYIDMPSELKSEIYTMEFDKTSSIEWVMEALSLITGKQIKKEGGGYQIY